jgi:hypothetical protein
MACGGHCNVCPAHPGYDPQVSTITWQSLYPTYCAGHTINTDDRVEENYHYYYLAYYINYEINRRDAGKPDGWDAWYSEAIGKTSDDIVYSDDWLMMPDGLNECDAWSPTWSNTQHMSAGAPILVNTINEMRDQMNTLRAECLCNCNYSCTCNCNYCTCNCNYACTCNCNYSDRRLKTDIKYL